MSEFVQTDPISISEKWTQKPVHIPINGDSFPTPEDYLGVGGDCSSEDGKGYSTLNALSSDKGRLSNFLEASSQVGPH